MDETPDPDERASRLIVVAVDGTEDSDRAVRYAAAEARRTGADLSLVHVLHQTAPTAPMLPLFRAETLRAVGRGILQDAAVQARALVGEDVEIHQHLLDGPRSAELVAAAGTSPIVMGPRASAFQRMLTGSTTAEVAAHAQGPVLCVPRDWEPGVEHGRVLVGVDASSASTGVLRAAFEAAADRHARLTVLHAWRPSGIYDAAIGGRVVADAWERQVEPVIWEMIAGLRADYPTVEVQVVLRFARPEYALAEEARHADLLVLGRRGEDRALGLSLGAKARALIHAGVCPIEVAPVPEPLVRMPAQRTSAEEPSPVIH
ncbi:MAG: universal stress protein [Nocardioidaceae bacterium]